MYRLHPAFEREIRSKLHFGGEAQRGADGAPAGGAVAQRGPPNLPSRCPAGEVSPAERPVCLDSGVQMHRSVFHTVLHKNNKNKQGACCVHTMTNITRNTGKQTAVFYKVTKTSTRMDKSKDIMIRNDFKIQSRFEWVILTVLLK